MCWPYTLIYGCWDCIADGRPLTEASVIVEPGADDPVVGGRNNEGSLCPLRYLGTRPDGQRQPISPVDCPVFSAASSSEPNTDVVNRAILNIFSDATSENDNSRCSPPQYRFWICHAHRPKYLALGPRFAGYELARRAEFVEGQRIAGAREETNGRQKQKRWNDAFKGLAESRSLRRKKRKNEESMKGEERTENTPATAYPPLNAASQKQSCERTGGLGRNKRRRYAVDELDLP